MAVVLGQASLPGPSFLLYAGLAVAASIVKIRLRGVDGIYSLNFLFLLAGVAYYSLPETVLACVAAALATTFLNTKKKPAPIQAAFNIGNLVLSVCASYLVAHGLFARGMHEFRPAWFVLITVVYFVVNTLIVSGVLKLLSGGALSQVTGKFYVWSFPYYLIGSAVVGLLPLGGAPAPPAEAWLVLPPLLYMIHFFHGLDRGTNQASKLIASHTPGHRAASTVFVSAISAIGVLLITLGGIHWKSEDPMRFAAFTAAGVALSMCKIWLPGIRGTMSCGFVMTLFSVVEMSLSEVIWMAAILSLAPGALLNKGGMSARQVLFSASALIASAGAAAAVCRWLLVQQLNASLPVALLVSTAVLYLLNSLLISVAMCLSEGKPVAQIWERMYFWGLPYYLVGAVAAGLMAVTARSAGWLPSLLVLPMMGLVYISYRMHVKDAAEAPPVKA